VLEDFKLPEKLQQSWTVPAIARRNYLCRASALFRAVALQIPITTLRLHRPVFDQSIWGSNFSMGGLDAPIQ
jgi:hypothetical protein